VTQDEFDSIMTLVVKNCANIDNRALIIGVGKVKQILSLYIEKKKDGGSSGSENKIELKT